MDATCKCGNQITNFIFVVCEECARKPSKNVLCLTCHKIWHESIYKMCFGCQIFPIRKSIADPRLSKK